MKIENALKLMGKFGEVRDGGYRWLNRDRDIPNACYWTLINGHRVEYYTSRGKTWHCCIYSHTTEFKGTVAHVIARALRYDRAWSCNLKFVRIKVVGVVNRSTIKRVVTLWVDGEEIEDASPVFASLLEGAIEDDSPAPLVDWLSERDAK